MKKLKRASGKWVAGENHFWDRKVEVELFIEYLDEGTHLHMVAQRRIGKTSLMREVARRIEDEYICLHVDLQRAKTPEDFLVELSAATHTYMPLWTKTKEVFSNVLGQAADRVDTFQIEQFAIKIREGLVQGNWEAKGDRLLDVLAEMDRPVVIFMDEIPILVHRILNGPAHQMTPERIASADAFMSWLRKGYIQS